MHRDRADNTHCNLDKLGSLHRVGRQLDRVDATVVALVVVVSMPVQGTVVVQVYTLAAPGLVVVDRACKQVGRAAHPPDRQVAHLLHVPGEKTPQTLAVAVVYPFPALKER